MDTKFILSIYAAIISTIVFLWRLYEFYDEKRGNLKVNLKITNQAFVYQNDNIGDWNTFLVAIITNTGKHKRLLERPQIKVDTKVKGKDIFSVISLVDKTNFPLALEPGEKYEYKMPIEAINEEFKNKGIKKVRSIIQDTHNKTYKSNWFKI